mmetsp:Transcript_122254/g.305154  ORF Transcript_122254/g.305154 Transcript_122254/m.305154 type:complete len:352 (-) Transcript_122254:316-1371(-)
MALECSKHKGCDPIGVRFVDIRTRRGQHLEGLYMAILRGEHQRCAADVVRCIQRRPAVAYQAAHDRCVALLGREHQGAVSLVAVHGRDVGTALGYEVLDDVHVPRLSGQEQRCGPVPVAGAVRWQAAIPAEEAEDLEVALQSRAEQRGEARGRGEVHVSQGRARQQPHDRRVARARGQDQRRRPWTAHGRVDRRLTLGQEKPNHGQVASLGGEHQSSASDPISRIDSAGLRPAKEARDLQMASLGSKHQRGVSFSVCELGIRPALQHQSLHDARVPVARRHHERGDALPVCGCVDSDPAVRDQLADLLGAALVGSNQQRRDPIEPPLGRDIRGTAVFRHVARSAAFGSAEG